MFLAILALQAAPNGAVGATQGAPYRTGPTADAGYRIGAGLDVTPSSAPAVELARTGVFLEDYDRSVEGRWGLDDPFYTSTVRGGAAIAQSRHGPLDGGWGVTDANGRTLYVLQLVDAGEGWLEGAWRRADPSAEGRAAASGFIALISREFGRVVLRFLEPGASAPTAVTVEMSPDGSWRGEAQPEGGPATPVRMVRR